MLSMLAAQEAERGIDARVWENAAIRGLLARAGAPADCPPAADFTWSVLDRENAALRRALISVHAAAEGAGNAPLDRQILTLYKEMADRRRLDLPPTP
jgi:hypothetical protein